MKLLLSGRVAIITGASKGIGRAISRVFAQEGAHVVCTARSAELVEETAALVREAGGEALAITADVANENDVRAMVERAVRHFGSIDCLVNNAGDSGPTKPVHEYPLEDWRYTIDSCLTSAYLCARFTVPAMIAAGRGAIVNVASMAGREGLAHRIGYCAAKAGQVGMIYGLAVELGPHNITANAIAPGAVEGDRIDRVFAGQAAIRGVSADAVREEFIQRYPLRRLVTADDVARLAAFLCSDYARNLSGQCIPVSAGRPAS